MGSNPFSLEGKTILVTGASSGIGRATALEISRAGASQCILVARNQERLEETASMLAAGCDSSILTCELTDKSQIEDLVAKLPKVDGVVLNAGINKMLPVGFINDKDLNQIFDTNCFAPMLLLRQLVRKKKLANPSSVVFTCSISGYTNVSLGNAMYGASKSALSAFMKYAALELAPKGVRCNAVHPGRVETPLIHSVGTDEKDMVNDMARYPLGRYGRPEEIAYAFVYLLSDAAGWITGMDLLIDGGRSLV